MNTIDVYRDDYVLVTIYPDKADAYNKAIMGDDLINITWTVNDIKDFKINDRIEIWGQKFYLLELPLITKYDTARYEHRLTFKAAKYMLDRVMYLTLGDDNSLKESKFSLHGNAKLFIELLMRNMRRLEPEVFISTYEVMNTDYKTITFDGVTCLGALGQIAQAFNTEYHIDGDQLSLTKKQIDKGWTFRHGEGKGMYELTRQTVDNTKLITRIYAFGSDKNLPYGYRNYSQYLKIPPLPRKQVSNVKTTLNTIPGGYEYVFEWAPPNEPNAVGVRIYSRSVIGLGGFINAANAGPFGRPQDVGLSSPQTYTILAGTMFRQFKFATLYSDGSEGPLSSVLSYPYIGNILDPTMGQVGLPLPVVEVVYLEKNVDIYGVFEHREMFDDIYPHREGTVTGISGFDLLEFTDASIDFDINANLLPGMTPKVVFNTGQLAGYTFDIESFNNTTKVIKFVRNKDEKSIELPNMDIRHVVGDKYTLIDLNMPQQYLDAAEYKVQERAQGILDVYSQPLAAYKLVLDPLFVKKNKYQFETGMLIWIVDDDFQINKRMRVIRIKRPVMDEYAYEVEIADELPGSRIQAIESGQVSLSNQVYVIGQQQQNSAINNNRPRGPFYFPDIQSKPAGELTMLGVDSEGRVWKAS